MPYFGNRTRTPPYRGSGYAGAWRSAANRVEAQRKHDVVNSNIKLEPEKPACEPKEK